MAVSQLLSASSGEDHSSPLKAHLKKLAAQLVRQAPVAACCSGLVLWAAMHEWAAMREWLLRPVCACACARAQAGGA